MERSTWLDMGYQPTTMYCMPMASLQTHPRPPQSRLSCSANSDASVLPSSSPVLPSWTLSPTCESKSTPCVLPSFRASFPEDYGLPLLAPAFSFSIPNIRPVGTRAQTRETSPRTYAKPVEGSDSFKETDSREQLAREGFRETFFSTSSERGRWKDEPMKYTRWSFAHDSTSVDTPFSTSAISRLSSNPPLNLGPNSFLGRIQAPVLTHRKSSFDSEADPPSEASLPSLISDNDLSSMASEADFWSPHGEGILGASFSRLSSEDRPSSSKSELATQYKLPSVPIKIKVFSPPSDAELPLTSNDGEHLTADAVDKLVLQNSISRPIPSSPATCCRTPRKQPYSQFCPPSYLRSPLPPSSAPVSPFSLVASPLTGPVSPMSLSALDQGVDDNMPDLRLNDKGGHDGTKRERTPTPPPVVGQRPNVRFRMSSSSTLSISDEHGPMKEAIADSLFNLVCGFDLPSEPVARDTTVGDVDYDSRLEKTPLREFEGFTPVSSSCTPEPLLLPSSPSSPSPPPTSTLPPPTFKNEPFLSPELSSLELPEMAVSEVSPCSRTPADLVSSAAFDSLSPLSSPGSECDVDLESKEPDVAAVERSSSVTPVIVLDIKLEEKPATELSLTTISQSIITGDCNLEKGAGKWKVDLGSDSGNEEAKHLKENIGIETKTGIAVEGLEKSVDLPPRKRKRKPWKNGGGDDEVESDIVVQKKKRASKKPLPGQSERGANSRDGTGGPRFKLKRPARLTEGRERELEGALIETFAASRASSLPVSTVKTSAMEAHPELADQIGSADWERACVYVLRKGREGTGVFGKVESSGKDDSGRSLESRWFYVPERDEDRERAALVCSTMPRPGKRNVTKNYKQYYYRPLEKISRWDPEDEI